jgi:diadenosine tetraphosphatase ApaH/serine/threonine PP2A family protein phosphatase
VVYLKYLDLFKAGYKVRYALISDVHANLAALQAVIEEIEHQDCGRVICLGDMVGYGPRPQRCLDIIRTLADHIILGNHDVATYNLPEELSFNPIARNAIVWTRSQLSERHISYLQQLPYTITFDRCLGVHASPCSPQSWNYITGRFDALRNFSCFSQPVSFAGHTHSPVVFQRRAGKHKVRVIEADHLQIEQGFQYIINIGSVGQPRDRDPRAAFGIWDSDQLVYRLVRVEYDISLTQGQMQEAGLPRFLSDRLEHGV